MLVDRTSPRVTDPTTIQTVDVLPGAQVELDLGFDEALTSAVVGEQGLVIEGTRAAGTRALASVGQGL
ncbi:MAG: hypothetical protein ACI8PQ_002696 [Planctomycetota bacterium]